MAGVTEGGPWAAAKRETQGVDSGKVNGDEHQEINSKVFSLAGDVGGHSPEPSHESGSGLPVALAVR